MKIVKTCKKSIKKLAKRLISKKVIAAVILLPLATVGVSDMAAYKSDQWIFDRVVQITDGESSCSGEQVRAASGKDYVLTAGHCRSIVESGHGKLIAEDGKEYPAKLITEDGDSDLLLLEGVPGLRGLAIAKSKADRQEVRTFTHGAALKAYKSSGVLIQDKGVKIGLFPILSKADADHCSMPKHSIFMDFFVPMCILSVDETYSTAFTAPGSSGGAVVDESGDLIGVSSAGGGGYSLFVRLIDIQKFMLQF